MTLSTATDCGNCREVAVKFENIVKRFGSVEANRGVNFEVYKGEILSLLGENGSGKTTLMNMLSGIYFPDEGKIYIDGEEAVIASPKDAFRYRIGMIHQHFKLVDVFTAAENIVLGIKDGKRFNRKKVNSRVREIAERYGFDIDPAKKIHEMSVSEKQTVEIIKVLYRGADILILDEPTAVLTPQETEKLFAVLRKMREDGKSIIIITHKLGEVMEISDRVAILRKGEYITTVKTSETNEKQLTEYMVGKKVDLQIECVKTDFDRPLLEIRDLEINSDEGNRAIDKVNFYIRGGEILGVAGIAGCGQKELCEAIAGLRKVEGGFIMHKGESIVGLPSREIIEKGISMSFIPEDRLGMGLAPSFSITDNMMLKTYAEVKTAKDFIHDEDMQCGVGSSEQKVEYDAGAKIAGDTASCNADGAVNKTVSEDAVENASEEQAVGDKNLDPELVKAQKRAELKRRLNRVFAHIHAFVLRPFVDRKSARERAVALIKKLDIVTPSSETPVRKLSGGNVQKVLVGREIEAGPNVIITAYPVRGLDINSSYLIYDILNEQKKKGTGILFIGEDLDVMLALCDKIMVLCHGKNMGIVHAGKATKEELGLMMTGSLDLNETKSDKKFGIAKDSNLTEEEWKAAEKEAEETAREGNEHD